MQKKSNGMTRSVNLSRQSSISSQGSNSSNKIVKKDSYISLSPRFDPEKGLAFQNEVKDNVIKTTTDITETSNQQKIGVLKKQSSFNTKNNKDEQQKKSQFSRIHRADSLQMNEG